MEVELQQLTHAIYPILVTVSGIKFFHTVVQLSPLLISRTFSSAQTETPHPLNNNSPFSLVPGNHYSTFCFYEFDSSRYLI